MSRITHILKSAMLLIYIAMSGTSYAQTQSTMIRVPDGRHVLASELNAHIEQAMQSMQAAGLSIAIVNKDAVVYHQTFGLANIQTQEPVTKQTLFEGASLSKPLFAYFLVKMAEQGKLDLDKPIYPFLEPVFPEGTVAPESLPAYKTLTPRIILSHGSGMPNWVRGEPIRIAFEPGSDFSYSGEAYQHLGAAFGLKLGIGWGGELDSLFIQEAALPMGMDRTLYTWDSEYDDVVARGHKDGKTNPKINKFKKVGPGFSLHSDAQDYALFLIEMMHPKHIKVSTRDDMLKTHTHFKPDSELLKETGQTGWGLGFAQKPTPHGMMHLHTGNNQDFQAYAMFIPEQEYGFVMFGNSNNLFTLLEAIETLLGEHF